MTIMWIRITHMRAICKHPVCKYKSLVPSNMEHFKNYVQTVHGIRLREPRFIDLNQESA